MFLLVGGDAPLLLLAQKGSLVLQGHYYWQLFTAMFVHFDLLHILLNMYGLYYFGRLNESYYPGTRFLVIYFGSGFLGNFASLYLLPLEATSGGASGAIFGLVGSYVAIEKKSRHLGMALVYAASIFLLSSRPGVNIFSHLFGLIGGLVLGLMLLPRRGAYTVSYSFYG